MTNPASKTAPQDRQSRLLSNGFFSATLTVYHSGTTSYHLPGLIHPDDQLSNHRQIRDFGSGQILQQRQPYLSPGFAQIAQWWLTCRDYFLAKVLGLVLADSTTNYYYPNRRVVGFHKNATLMLIFQIEKIN